MTTMTATEDRRTAPHPAWCNLEHRPGGNPLRQSHHNNWESQKIRDLMRLNLVFHPWGSDIGEPKAGVLVRAAARMHGRLTRRVNLVLSVDDLRSLGHRLLDLADAADLEGRRAAERRAVQS